MKMNIVLALSPLFVLALGGVLLMITEAFSHRREEGDARESGPSSDLAMITATLTCRWGAHLRSTVIFPF